MRKVKKFLALAVAMVMMFAMSITAAAYSDVEDDPAYGATITVVGADEADLTYAQVIVADRTTETGWAIVSGYDSLFASYGNDEQSMIKGWIAASSDTEAARIAGLGDAEASDEFPNPLTGAKPGLYLIKGSENGFTFSPMLVFVSLDDAKEGTNITVVAKKTPITIDKKLSDAQNDHYAELNSEVSYDVTVTVPYLPEGGEASLVITDTLDGGTFKTVKEGENSGKVEVKLSIEDTPRYIAPTSDTALEIDLGDLISEDNENANKTVVVTYTAIMAADIINNTAELNHDPETDVTVTTYVGKLKITKYNEADATNKEALEGASFVIINEDGKYAELSNNQLVKWVDEYTEACYLTTGDDGTAIADGFDPDKTYTFKEVVAPQGYSVNKNDVVAVWKADMADDQQIAEAEMYDTKLGELPFTGGKGTAAFTGFGVLLMSVAAGLYFANKKNKSVK